MSAADARVVMMDLYENRFGIYNHLAGDKNPLSSVLLHDKEEVWMDSSLRDMIEDFALYDIGELWKISLVDFLKLPHPYVEIMRRVRDGVVDKKKKEMKLAEQGFGLK